MTLKLKTLALSFGAAALTATALVVVGLIESSRFEKRASVEVDHLTDEFMEQVLSGARSVATAQADLLEQNVAANVRVALDTATRQGGIRLGEESVTWKATNQFTKDAQEVTLRRVLVGGKWMGQVKDPNAPVPLVDQMGSLTGATYTVFQRMNEAGDMLRVATNVINKEGQRGTGTYIPAIGADGTPNPVVASLLKGESYVGTAFVVNQWYVTAYAPVRSASGEVIGAVYSGVPETGVESLRTGISGVKVGDTGFMFSAFNAGSDAGKFALAPDGHEDYGDALALQDAKGEPWMKTVLEKSVELKDGEFAQFHDTIDFEGGQRECMVMYTNFAPWKWVIVAVAPLDELDQTTPIIAAGRQKMVRSSLIAALLAMVAAGGVIHWSTGRSLRGLNAAVALMEEVASGEGDLRKRLQDKTKDEVGQLGRAFNRFVARLEGIMIQVSVAAHQTLEGAKSLKEAAENVEASTQQIDEITVAIHGKATTSADHLRETEQGMEELSHAVDAVARGSQEQAMRLESSTRQLNGVTDQIGAVAESARGATESAEEVKGAADDGAARVRETIDGMERISDSTHDAADLIRQLGEAGAQIGAIVQGIENIAEQTNLLALNAAIEAARAGEHGRGFAVVADEVRKLAENAASETRSIADLILNVQGLTQKAVQAMETGTQEVEKGQQLAESAGEALRKIQESVESVVGKIEAVSEVSGEINAAAAAVMDDVNSLAAITQETTASAEEMSASCQEMAGQVQRTSVAGREQVEAAERVAMVTNDASDVVRGMLDRAEELTGLSQDLSVLVSQFKTRQGREGDQRLLLDPSDPRVQARVSAIENASAKSAGHKRFTDAEDKPEVRRAA